MYLPKVINKSAQPNKFRCLYFKQNEAHNSQICYMSTESSIRTLVNPHMLTIKREFIYIIQSPNSYNIEYFTSAVMNVWLAKLP